MKELNTEPIANFRLTGLIELTGKSTFLGCPLENSISNATLSTKRKTPQAVE
jgi:hypothetical protein